MARIQLRRGTTEEWATANPILAQGEPGVDVSTGVLRIGDGESSWAELPDVSASPEQIGEIVSGLDVAIKTAPNTFLAPQTFDPADAIRIGDKLQLRFTDGFFGQRLHLTGLPQPDGEDDIMPYMEVAATTLTGTDVGGAVAGYQLYRTPGGGGVPDREFLAIEASGDLATTPGFKISPWASGTGQLRPIAFWDGTHEVFRIVNEGGTGALRLGTSARITMLDEGTAAPKYPIILQRQGSFGDQRRVYSSTGATRAYIFFSKNRGTFAAPTPPGSGDLLGDLVFGSFNGSTEVPSAIVRATSKQAWTYGSAQGSKVGILTTPTGAASSQVQAEFDEPTVDGEIAILVRVNRAGVRTLERVTVGAPGTGGTGRRALTVAGESGEAAAVPDGSVAALVEDEDSATRAAIMDIVEDSSELPISVPGDITATGTAGATTYLRGDGAWATPTNTTYTAASQVEIENPASTTARLITGQRAAQAVIAQLARVGIGSGANQIGAFWIGTQAELDLIDPRDESTLYWVTDAE